MGCSQAVRQWTLTPSSVGSNPATLDLVFRKKLNRMKTLIYFSENSFALKEKTLPIVKLTKSKNGETGTATFVFIQPSIFLFRNPASNAITGMYLHWGNKNIMTNDINIVFQNGRPFLLKAILIFKNSQEWFHFLNFMTCYSKETGLLFSEKNSFS